jgi:hypothetical protein
MPICFRAGKLADSDEESFRVVVREIRDEAFGDPRGAGTQLEASSSHLCGPVLLKVDLNRDPGTARLGPLPRQHSLLEPEHIRKIELKQPYACGPVQTERSRIETAPSTTTW